MRSTLLLTSFLAVIPLISATPSRVEYARQASATTLPLVPTLVSVVQLLPNNSWNFSQCMSAGNLPFTGHIPGAPATLTIFNCVNACDGENYIQAGIGGSSQSGDSQPVCTCGNSTTVNSLPFTRCEQNGCPGALDEICGADDSQVYYLKNRN